MNANKDSVEDWDAYRYLEHIDNNAKLEYIISRGQEHIPAPALHGAITQPSHGNMMPRVAWWQTYTSIPTTHLRQVKSTNIPTVESRPRAWRPIMATC